jgi:hypothetical protein
VQDPIAALDLLPESAFSTLPLSAHFPQRSPIILPQANALLEGDF